MSENYSYREMIESWAQNISQRGVDLERGFLERDASKIRDKVYAALELAHEVSENKRMKRERNSVLSNLNDRVYIIRQ
ncbi:MAG TPA: hypothetical protein VJ208_03700 [Candidatus Nanoarchaeia archaeon]|nr:hypothetical protein [Candidatus Nanoarchaeia archaeon]